MSRKSEYKKLIEESKRDYEKCANFIEKILSLSDELIINGDSYHDFAIDNIIIRALEDEGIDKYIAHDISGDKFLKGIPCKVLLDFAQEERIFKNNNRKFRIQDKYVEHGPRYFTAEKIPEKRRIRIA